MPHKSLSDFAPELIVPIFKSLSSSRDIIALNSTCTYLFKVWHSNTVSISDAVRHNLECYQDALELLQLQGKLTTNGKLIVSKINEESRNEEKKLIQMFEKLRISEECDVARRAALALNKPFSVNAAKIQLACKNRRSLARRDEIVLGISMKRARRVYHLQEGSFVHAYYRLWILAETNDQQIRKSYLDSIGMEENRQLNDVAQWLKGTCSITHILGISNRNTLDPIALGWDTAFKEVFNSLVERRTQKGRNLPGSPNSCQHVVDDWLELFD